MITAMIYTVTLNPALDYAVVCPEFEKGALNVYSDPLCSPGGKGINVSLVLNELGTASSAMGFCAGFTGRHILKLLKEKSISCDFLELKSGDSRINFKICSEKETEINGKGPLVSAGEANAFLEKFGTLKAGDILVLAGSLPASLPDDYYETILSRLNRDVMTIVDATGSRLTGCLKYSPFLIKPNHVELGEIFGADINSPEKAGFYGRKLIDRGARNVLISMGSQGAVFAGGDGTTLFMPAIKGIAVSACGAGDSTVAGFIYGYAIHNDIREALCWGTAAGAATAFTKGIASGGFIREKAAELAEALQI